jgi:hypothetical protein
MDVIINPINAAEIEVTITFPIAGICELTKSFKNNINGANNAT